MVNRVALKQTRLLGRGVLACSELSCRALFSTKPIHEQLQGKSTVTTITQYQDSQQEKHVKYSFDGEYQSGHRKTLTPLSKFTDETLPVRARQTINSIISIFLPKGYPHSVGNGYISFVQTSMASAVLSSAGGVLSMQALLYAIGLGAGSIPLAATLNWILKDGMGQLGGVLFASFVNNRFDSDPKRWRFLASVSLEVSNAIELLTPLVPSLFLPLASIANVGKNISFLAASASRAAIHKTFAISENLADITAKTGSQNILSSMLGTSLGITAASFAGNNDIMTTMGIFSLMSLSSMFLSFRSLHHVTINTISLGRLEKIVENYFNTEENKTKAIASPQQITQYEKLFGVEINASYPKIFVGKPLNEVFKSITCLETSRRRFLDQGYLLQVNVNKANQEFDINILFEVDASAFQVIHAFTLALLLRKELTDGSSLHIASLEDSQHYNDLCLKYLPAGEKSKELDEFVQKLIESKDWHIAINVLEEKISRIQW